MQIIKAIWGFFQNQILGMKWLNSLIGNGLSALGLDANSRWGGSVQFFIYDTIKILVLLSVLIFIISYIQSYFPPERTKKILGRFHGLTANTLAALLGTVTPFCSCSSIPLFIGFSSAGLPVGITFSFLISSPLVDLGSLVLLMSIFGTKVAVAYVVVGLILAVIGGSLIEKLGMGKYVENFIKSAGSVDIEAPELSKRDRLVYAKEQVYATVKKVILYVLIGVGIGAVIHNWIPTELIQTVLGGRNPFSVILATVVGIPMYADIFGTIPIAEALFYKGAGLGTILSFMMAVTALSAPSIIMLRRAVKPKLLVVFVSIVAVGIMIIGYTFNTFQFLLV
ncbi:MAG: permease [Lachnospiraceae bacterium]|nr:permease [Lachnospiraceae bacterium]